MTDQHLPDGTPLQCNTLQYLFLWSGTLRGYRKTTVPAVHNTTGVFGHRHRTDVYRPCPASVRTALPHWHRPAFDRTDGQFWYDLDDATAPALLHLHDSRSRLATIYLQPLWLSGKGSP